MKLLHTADWHLGKTLKGQNLIEDQKIILDQILEIAKDVDAILICGDIYDRAVPPVDAVELFNETLTKLAEKNLPTLIIAGNHDSATRLNFGNKIFERQNIFIAAKISDKPNVVLEDNFGEIYFSMIPFVDSEKIPAIISSARAKIPNGKRSVALAHVFLTGGIESESERKFVGGAENVSADIFSDYNYVALGHLHSPQKFYSGSPLKYSFDEANHKKSVTIVDIDGAGNVKTEKINLKPLHDVIVVEGKFNELIRRPKTEDYAQIILTDDVYIYETELLRNSFPNFLEVKRKNHLKSYDDNPTNNFRKEDSISEQFAKFFESVTTEPLNNDELAAFEEILKEIEREDRE
ncbi:MAG: exonuclease SbcCD subunit D [Selenomonadaceae bacterium]|nr:exonuclease SbcCD subunit D [Selenomonadaceae bacterium]